VKKWFQKRSSSPKRKQRAQADGRFLNPQSFFIIVCCLIIAIVGTVTLVRMPVDLFPPINIPVVVWRRFIQGCRRSRLKRASRNPFERFSR